VAKKKATGMSKRVSFLDRDVVREDREIQRYNREAERAEREASRAARAREKLERERDELLGGIEAKGAVRVGLEELVSGLSARKPFGEATRLAWEEAVANSTGDLEELREDWAAALAEVATRAKANGAKVPAWALKGSAVDPARRELVRAGAEAAGEDAARVRRGVEVFVDALLKGERIKGAAARGWRALGASDDERTRVGQVWARTARGVSEVWGREHDDVLPTEAQEKEARRKALAADLTRAGEAVESWPIFAYEGAKLVSLLVAGQDWSDAKAVADEALAERADKVSPAEWQVVRGEWSKITEAVSTAWRRKRR
jgi:hypothetical protein